MSEPQEILETIYRDKVGTFHGTSLQGYHLMSDRYLYSEKLSVTQEFLI
ncbi:MAG: hypothetical protein F6K40_06420 [Okeania sp. SIO3I5]|nr:hypothetical protein [Okeania sp. SIO3I5]NEQ35939.1 hypothetical protein [Okeania sp. SIO3I5]